MSDEEFAKFKKSMADKLLEKNRNLENESSRMWSHITSRYCDFEQHLTDSALILIITRAELLEFFDANIAASAPNRAKASVHIISSKNVTKSFSELAEGSTDVTFVEAQDLPDLHSQLELTEHAMPVRK